MLGNVRDFRSYRDKTQVRAYIYGMECTVCGRWFNWSGRGRQPLSCGQRCRKRRSRNPQLPESMTRLPRWCARDGKKPVQLNGRNASTTKPWTWAAYRTVCHGPHGVMLGGGLGCYDLDDVINDDGSLHPDAVTVLEQVDGSALWVERSMSGRGLHVFVRAPEQSGRVAEHVSFYSKARFIAVTGDKYQY